MTFVRIDVSAIEYRVGETYEVLSMITMREGEDFSTGIVGEVTAGNVAQVLELGTGPSGRRLKVSVAGQIGWVSCETSKGEQLISRRKVKKMEDLRSDTKSSILSFRSNSMTGLRSDTMSSMSSQYTMSSISSESTAATWSSDSPEEDERGETVSIVTIRESASSDSPVMLNQGVIFSNKIKILENVASEERRSQAGCMTLATKKGEFVVDRASGVATPKQGSSMLEGAAAKIRALLQSAHAGKFEEVKKAVSDIDLLSKVMSGVTVNGRDVCGMTSLAYAAACGHKDVVVFLLQQKDIHVNAIDKTRRTSLHHASKKAKRPQSNDAIQAEIIHLLIEHGAYIEARDQNGCTALMLACTNTDLVMTKMLIQYGASVNVADNDGYTPLDYAKRFCRDETVKFLRERGAVVGDDNAKKKALLEGARDGDLEAVKKAVGFGVNIGTSDTSGWNALAFATNFGNKDVVEYLLQQKDIDVNAMDKKQRITLHHAAKKTRKRAPPQGPDTNQAAIIEMLIQHGAYVEARDENGCTPLMLACTNRDLSMTKMLMHYGASLNVKDNQGRTPLDYAMKPWFLEEPVKFLKELGAESGEVDEGDIRKQCSCTGCIKTSNEQAALAGEFAARSSLPPSSEGEGGEAGQASPFISSWSSR